MVRGSPCRDIHDDDDDDDNHHGGDDNYYGIDDRNGWNVETFNLKVTIKDKPEVA